ncbi:MAG: 3-oxoacyl-ACP reductase FabG [Ktedonobacteraceae bacterium]|nr:3-oxoacyl-ACP reductase FabG [Ktedonobacteraceae bacterium]
MEHTKSKTVIITGGTRGIGKAIALTLARQNRYNLILNYRTDDAAAQEALQECKSIHPNVHIVQADVSQRSDVEALMQEAYTTFHSIDVLINNAGINSDKPLQEMTDNDWNSVVDTNMKGVFLCSQIASLYMLQQEQEGIILTIGASTGIRGRKNGLNYCASKAGVLVMTKCLALELSPKIRVNCVIPGSIWTEETEKRHSYRDPQRLHAKEEQIPLKRIGTPEEVADVVAFLLIHEARYLNGQKILVDGGEFMW